MPEPHDKIIVDAANLALSPLGFRRKGRSRLWLADKRWWIAIVEFQPSRWSKGCYLNVAAHWLWNESNDFSLDYGGRIGSFIEYASDEQFSAAILALIDKAVYEVDRLFATFTSITETAQILLSAERAPANRYGGHWHAFNAGVAAGLIGKIDDAEEMFAAILRKSSLSGSILHRSAERMTELVTEPTRFRTVCGAVVAERRASLDLPSLDKLLF